MIDFGDKVIAIDASGARTFGMVAFAITCGAFFYGFAVRKWMLVLAYGLALGMLVEYLRFILVFSDVAVLSKHELKYFQAAEYQSVFLLGAVVVFVLAVITAYLSNKRKTDYVGATK